MVTCPVCETQQPPSQECTTCGMALAAAPAPPELPPEVMPGLETTDLAARNDAPTPLVVANAPCSWCKHVQPSGVYCDRCGMQRHRGSRSSAAAVTDDDGTVMCGQCGVRVSPGKCRNCGGRVHAPEE